MNIIQRGDIYITKMIFPQNFFFIIKGFVTFHRNEIIFDEEKNSSIVDVEKFILGPDNYFGEIDLIYDKKNICLHFVKPNVI